MLLKRSLVIRENHFGSRHPDLTSSLNNLATLYTEQGRYVEAEPLFKRALVIGETELGLEHPNVASILENYATLLHKTNRRGQAVRMAIRARAIRAKQN